MGNFNNVCNPRDKIGGKLVVESQYMDFTNMMDNMGLFEKDNVGDHFTWFNKNMNEAIYSRIDMVIFNMQWIQMHMGTIMKVMELGVSDHALLCLKGQDKDQKRKYQSKFQNDVINTEGFQKAVKASWDKQVKGTTMYIVWKKLYNLQNVIKDKSKGFKG